MMLTDDGNAAVEAEGQGSSYGSLESSSHGGLRITQAPRPDRPLRVLVIDGNDQLGEFAAELLLEPARWDLIGVARDLDRGFHLAMAGHPDVVVWAWVPGVTRLLRALDMLAGEPQRCLTVLVRPPLATSGVEAIPRLHHAVIAPEDLSCERITALWQRVAEDASAARRPAHMRQIARRA
jgi:hypothetical protein